MWFPGIKEYDRETRIQTPTKKKKKKRKDEDKRRERFHGLIKADLYENH